MVENVSSPKIKISAELMAQIEQHSYSNLTAEVGGMLIGAIKGQVTEIVGVIPARSAAAEQISLTFTHDVWAEILTEVSRKFPNSQIVGWYHTHPSFGLFLSQYDEFIQQNFFKEPGQVALVIDPIAGRLAWFYDKTGKIKKFGEKATKSGPRERAETAPPTPKRQTARIVLWCLLSAVLSGVIVWGTMQLLSPPNSSSALKAASERNRALEQELLNTKNQMLGVEQNPVLIVNVQAGQTLQSISHQFYGEDRSTWLAEINGLKDTNSLQAGQTLLLPSVPNVTVDQRTAQQVIPVTVTPEPTPSVAINPTTAATQAP